MADVLLGGVPPTLTLGFPTPPGTTAPPLSLELSAGPGPTLLGDPLVEADVTAVVSEELGSEASSQLAENSANAQTLKTRAGPVRDMPFGATGRLLRSIAR
ncbi:MAG TPA: hypothetical protein VHM70_10915 [Polyangiaceae bacterium]|nr:hypothetical protein [Polyangiaceae bacterium]